jgi:membrane-anchored protein YejM (alkaline phosphatase superfamily)
VSADSATDAWAAGQYYNSSGVTVPLILHWDGTAWKKAASPAGGARGHYLYGVSGDSAADAWAAGQKTNSSGVTVPLILHWDGTAWKKAASPAPSGAHSTSLYGVSADSAADAWAAGAYTSSSGVGEPLILHWNGTAWKKVKSPNGA